MVDMWQAVWWPVWLTGIDDPRQTADEMDAQRQENIAYEYLCHLEEAKTYVELHCFFIDWQASV